MWILRTAYKFYLALVWRVLMQRLTAAATLFAAPVHLANFVVRCVRVPGFARALVRVIRRRYCCSYQHRQRNSKSDRENRQSPAIQVMIWHLSTTSYTKEASVILYLCCILFMDEYSIKMFIFNDNKS